MCISGWVPIWYRSSFETDVFARSGRLQVSLLPWRLLIAAASRRTAREVLTRTPISSARVEIIGMPNFAEPLFRAQALACRAKRTSTLPNWARQCRPGLIHKGTQHGGQPRCRQMPNSPARRRQQPVKPTAPIPTSAGRQFASITAR